MTIIIYIFINILLLYIAPIACILGAIGMSAILTRFSALIKVSHIFAKPVTSPETGKSTVSTLSPSLSIMVLSGATFLLLMFSYHATYVSSIAYSSPSIVIDAGRTNDGRRVLYDDYREVSINIYYNIMIFIYLFFK